VSGNLTSEAIYGGKPKELAFADPKRMKAALMELARKKEELKLESFEVTLEATHHGPTGMKVPLLFVEIGSSLKEWRNAKAGRAVASAVMAACNTRANWKSSVGFGGGHYAKKHTKAVLTSELAIGHILPKYFFAKEFDLNVVAEAFKKTLNSCNTAVIDWKGMKGRDRSELINFLEEKGIEIVKV